VKSGVQRVKNASRAEVPETGQGGKREKEKPPDSAEKDFERWRRKRDRKGNPFRRGVFEKKKGSDVKNVESGKR